MKSLVNWSSVGQALGLALVVFAVPACADKKRSPGVELRGSADPSIQGCSTPKQGCACDVPNQKVECGDVKSQDEGYVFCSVGERTCDAGAWSACEVSGTRTQALKPQSGNSRLLAQSAAQSCALENPCDPFCNKVVDNPVGVMLDAGAGVQHADGGVSLIKTEIPPMTVPCTALTIAPNPSTLTVTQFSPVSPRTQQFTATVTPAGCYPGTPPVLWSIDRFDIATIDGNGLLTLVSPIGGPINVSGYAGSLSATTTLNIRVNVVDTSAAPAGTSNSFPATTGSADDAKVLYPYVDTVLPLGLLPPLVQWNTGTPGAAAAVKLSVRYPATGTAIFQWSQIIAESRTIKLDPPTNVITLAAGPRAEIPASVWTAFERTAKGQDALVVLQRLTGTTLRAEIPTRIHFATGQLKGTVYYQSYGTNLVKNYGNTFSGQTIGANARFGAATLAIRPGATFPTVVAGYTSSDSEPGCRVCHSAAANGGAIVSNKAGSNSTLFRPGVDAASGGLNFPAASTGLYSWPAIYPDSTFIFGNSGPSPLYGSTPAPGGFDGSAWVSGSAPPNKLYSLTPGSLGNEIVSSGFPANARATMPVFSTDGTRLAFNHYSGTVGSVTGDKRSLAMVNFSNATKTFSNFRRLVTQPTTPCSALFGTTDPCTNVWPTFLPGNEGVIYEREILNNGRIAGSNHADFGGTRSGCDGSGACSNDGTKADLWWVTTAATPVAARLNQAIGLRSDSTLYLPTNAATSHTTVNEPIVNYEPTMSPTAIGGYYWVAFTSRRLYGNVATMNPWWSDPRFHPLGGSQGASPKKIWVAAISTNPGSGTDPSYPAFYMPGQELLAGNSKAYWSLQACVNASSTRSTSTECESDLDCCNAPTQAVCSLQTPLSTPPKLHCIPNSAAACIPDNSASQCSSDGQCCGFAAGSRCASGICKEPPPLLVFGPGTLERDFYGECASDQTALWQVVQWQATLPVGTSINFRASTATTAAGLAAAPKVAVGTANPPSTTTWATNPLVIENQLKAIGQTSRSYLRLTMTLNPSTDRLLAPTLKEWRVIYDCIDAQ